MTAARMDWLPVWTVCALVVCFGIDASAQPELGSIRLTGDEAYRQRYADLESRPAPPLAAERWIGSAPLDWDALRGRVVLLDFWGVWCAPCVKSTPQLIRLHDLYADRGLVVIGVHTQARKDGAEAYTQDKGIPYPVMIDRQDRTAAAYRVEAFPTAHLVDHRGVLRYADIEVLEDGLFRGDVERAIRQLLDEREADLGVVRTPGFDTRFTQDVTPQFEAAEAAGFAGFTIVQQRGRRLLERASGLADRGAGRPWTADTVSTIGSITKPLTAVAILKLQERGALDVQDSIAEHLPGVPADKREVTIHHLLTHTSGIRNLSGIGDWDPINREAFLARIFSTPLASEPGETYAYSNAGYSVLAAIIEVATGETYERRLRRSVLSPAGMSSTGYLLPKFPGDRMAVGYRDGERWGTVLERPMAPDGPYWGLRGNGGIHSTPRDMMRFAETLLDGTLLTEESLDAMWTAHVREGPDAPTWYGYGWAMLRLPTGERAVFHNGGNGVFFADLAIAPESATILFMMTNVLSEFPLAREITFYLGDRLLVGPTPFGLE